LYRSTLLSVVVVISHEFIERVVDSVNVCEIFLIDFCGFGLLRVCGETMGLLRYFRISCAVEQSI